MIKLLVKTNVGFRIHVPCLSKITKKPFYFHVSGLCYKTSAGMWLKLYRNHQLSLIGLQKCDAFYWMRNTCNYLKLNFGQQRDSFSTETVSSISFVELQLLFLSSYRLTGRILQLDKNRNVARLGKEEKWRWKARGYYEAIVQSFSS